MNKCPRCNLPQEGIYKCQYCGYDLSKNKKKQTKTLQNRLKDIIGAFNKDYPVIGNKRNKVRPIDAVNKNLNLPDNGGTRSGTDRRKYRLITYFPEKRSGRDRRKGVDRRIQIPRKRWSERRFSLSHGKPYPRET